MFLGIAVNPTMSVQLMLGSRLSKGIGVRSGGPRFPFLEFRCQVEALVWRRPAIGFAQTRKSRTYAAAWRDRGPKS